MINYVEKWNEASQSQRTLWDGHQKKIWSTYHLVWWVVCFQLFVVGVLHEDGMISDDGCYGGVVSNHRLCYFFGIHFQESLHKNADHAFSPLSPKNALRKHMNAKILFFDK